MPLRERCLVAAMVLAVGLSLGWPVPAFSSPAPAPAASGGLTADLIERRLDELSADPNLPGVHMEKHLRRRDEEARTPRRPWSLPAWLIGLGAWVNNAGRVLVWGLGMLAVALIAVSLRHWARVRAHPFHVEKRSLPTHVRDLDIRPQSLPSDVGATARDWWFKGERRAALSLLYRGALSRLVHQHAVPVRGASTEGETVKLAWGHLAQPHAIFFEQLVTLWQSTVYGRRVPEDAAVLALCDGFDAHLGSTVREAAT